MMRMVRIEIGNSYSQIIGLKTDEFRRLRQLLSYKPNEQAAYFSGGYAKPKYLLDKKGYFPTGLRQTVEDFLDSSTTYEISDTRVPPVGDEFFLNLRVKIGRASCRER